MVSVQAHKFQDLLPKRNRKSYFAAFQATAKEWRSQARHKFASGNRKVAHMAVSPEYPPPRSPPIGTFTTCSADVFREPL
jgi:hypothetical protein